MNHLGGVSAHGLFFHFFIRVIAVKIIWAHSHNELQHWRDSGDVGDLLFTCLSFLSESRDGRYLELSKPAY